MGKKNRKNLKSRKPDPKIKDKKKKKKVAKKLGLAKYIHNDSKPNKAKIEKDEETIELEENKRNIQAFNATNKAEKKNMSLVERCKQQMSSSLLRLIDESIYKCDTKHVPIDKDKFVAYHDAYSKVCEKWPTKPIDYIVKFIKKRILSAKRPITKFKFADIGCGQQPLLKMKLPPKAKVMSFDLVSLHEDIVEANMEKLPLEDASIDCAIYSLSLMAKNLGSILLEGKRILKVGGSLIIVEVTSRFENQEKRFIGKLEKIGLKKKSCKQLKPNAFFTFFHFAKVDAKMEYPNSNLRIELKPCVYKVR